MRKVKIAAIAITLFVSLIVAGSSVNAQNDAWETYQIPGATVKFSLPKPVRMHQETDSGMVVYASKIGKKKMTVGILKRNYQQDQAKGSTDDKVLFNFYSRILAANKIAYKKMNLQWKMTGTGDLKFANGKGKQVNAQVGKASILYRFYVTKQGLYFVEAITQNTQDPMINRFLKSFSP